MDIKEYISSGILELYASGALNEAEVREVESMIARYPEVRAELDAIQVAMNQYAGLHKRNPPPELRQKVLDKIEEIDGKSPAKVFPLNTEPTVQQYYTQPGRSGYLMAAVWLFLVLNMAGNIFFYTKLKGTEEQLSGVINESSRLRQEYEKIRLDMDKKTGDIKMVMNRSNKIVDLKGMDNAPQASATVYWNPNTKQVMLSVESLPMPPDNMQYQLWALKDGKPVDAGVFDMKPGSGDDMHMMPVKVMEADAFAVTLEKMGGSPSPDLSQLYVMGKM